MNAFLFPGQGSQKKGMGGDLFKKYPSLMKEADEILGYSISELCLKDPNNQINHTLYTQPAIYVVNALYYYESIKKGPPPDYAVGHSLGEYNGLLAAKVFDFKTGLLLVKKRAELMSQAKRGGMAAVIGLTKEEVDNIIKQDSLMLEVANYNTDKQIVIAGDKAIIESAEEIFCDRGALSYVILSVSAAFHSSFMKPFSILYRKSLKEFKFETPSFPVISNVTARPHVAKELKENLSRQIFSPVRWQESINFLVQKGVKNFKEIGDSTVLSNMMKYIWHEVEKG